MIGEMCPLCGKGVLEKSIIAGYECSNCGEVFIKGKDMEWEVIPYADWIKYVKEKETGKDGTKNKNTGGKRQ